MAALQIKNLPTGAGDDIKIDASYAKGDTKAVISTSGGSPSFAMFGGTGLRALTRALASARPLMAVYLPGRCGGTGGIKLADAWGIRGAFNHNWDPYWSTSLWGSYAQVRTTAVQRQPRHHLGQGSSALLRSYQRRQGRVLLQDYSCNPDYNIAQVGVVTRWTPVKNLTFSAEVGAFFLDQKMSGARSCTAAAPKPTTVYEFKDQSTVFLNVRAQRNF